jgi:uncharacterized protein
VYESRIVVRCAARSFWGRLERAGHGWVVAGVGRGVEKDPTKALELFDMGCEFGNSDACDLAGRSHMESCAAASSGAAADEARAKGISVLDRACSVLESAPACNFLGEIFLVGRFGVPVDKGRAAKLLEAACDRFEMTACRNLMVMYRRGDGVAKDLAKADEFRRRAVQSVEQQTGKKLPDMLKRVEERG